MGSAARVLAATYLPSFELLTGGNRLSLWIIGATARLNLW